MKPPLVEHDGLLDRRFRFTDRPEACLDPTLGLPATSRCLRADKSSAYSGRGSPVGLWPLTAVWLLSPPVRCRPGFIADARSDNFSALDPGLKVRTLSGSLTGPFE